MTYFGWRPNQYHEPVYLSLSLITWPADFCREGFHLQDCRSLPRIVCSPSLVFTLITCHGRATSSEAFWSWDISKNITLMSRITLLLCEIQNFRNSMFRVFTTNKRAKEQSHRRLASEADTCGQTVQRTKTKIFQTRCVCAPVGLSVCLCVCLNIQTTSLQTFYGFASRNVQ